MLPIELNEAKTKVLCRSSTGRLVRTEVERVAEGAETNSFFNAVGRPAERTRVLEVVQSYQAKQGAYKAEARSLERTYPTGLRKRG